MLIAVVGPTGVGKTKLSVELAKKYDAIIVNSDAMQVYKGLNIGTAKVTETEKENVPHYLFDIKEVTEDYSVYDYQKDLRQILDNNQDKNIIIVGGTGLYLKAGLFDYKFELEEEKKEYLEHSDEELYKLLLEKHPDTEIHANNRKRIVRALNKKQTSNNKDKQLYECTFIGLTTDRTTLYEKINNRVDKMINNGLIEEVKAFYDRGIFSKAIMTGIGYKELYEYFKGNLSLEEATDLIKQKSRKYAKRQYTWFNNQMDINWLEVDFDNFDKTILEAIKIIENKN